MRKQKHFERQSEQLKCHVKMGLAEKLLCKVMDGTENDPFRMAETGKHAQTQIYKSFQGLFQFQTFPSDDNNLKPPISIVRVGIFQKDGKFPS